MLAIVIEKFGGPDSLVFKDIPEPEPKAGHVVIEIKALLLYAMANTHGSAGIDVFQMNRQ